MSNTDRLFYGIDFKPDSREPINFLETRLTDLSSFSAHEVELESEVFKTVEHGYQALRLKPGKGREQIKTARSPMDAWREGQKYKNSPDLLVDDFDKDEVMEKLFRAKFLQHEDIKSVLLATKNRELLKVYDTDYYWGTGADGTGQNKMGKLWMKLRSELE